MADLETLAELSRAAVADVSACSPAELHGAVCGLAVFNPSPYPFDGLADLLDGRIDPADPSLVSFVDATCSALEADDFGFALLLPELDDSSTSERLAELARWCSRFLDAFARGLADFSEPEDGDFDSAGPFLPTEIQEIIDDFAAIAEADSATAEDLSDEVDSDLVELEEFVKVGVLLMRSVLSHDDTDNPA